MVRPGEIYWADLPEAARRPVVVVSRAELNRGSHLVVMPLTTAQWEWRRSYANCVPFMAGEFGLSRNCVGQAERIAALAMANLELHDGPIGQLDDERMRQMIRAIGYVLEAECEPA